MLMFDRSIRCMQVVAGVLGRAGEEGQRKRLEAAKTGKVTWLAPPNLGRPFSAEEEKRKASAEADSERKRLLEDKAEEERAQVRRDARKFKIRGEDDDL